MVRPENVPGTLELANVASYLAAILVNIVVLYWARQQEHDTTGRLFQFTIATLLVWTLISLLRFLVPSHGAKIALFHTRYVFQWANAIGWFAFAMYYTDYDRLLDRRHWAVIAGWAGLMIGAVATNPWHGLVWVDYAIVSEPFVHLSPTPNALYWVVLGTGYLFPLTAIAVLFAVILQSKRATKMQAAGIAGGLGLALALHALQAVELLQINTAIGTAILGAIIAHTLMTEDLLLVEPVTRTDVMESVGEAIIVVGNNHHIADYNSVAVDAFPDIKDADGVPVSGVVPDLIVESETGKQSFADEITVSRGGDKQHFTVSVEPVESHGSRRGYTIVLRDVTKVKEYARDLEHQTEQLDEFTSFVSHDLRNPLAVAQTYMYDFQSDYEEDDDRIEVINEAFDRMSGMIDDSLTLAREGRAFDERNWASLSAIAEDAWETSRTADAELDNSIPQNVSVYVDDSRVQTLFENLFRNAVDHGPDNVTVRIGVNGDETFYVEDDGPGIPKNDREKVFREGFTTSDDGTGLGLSIVEGVAKAHGWDPSVGESRWNGARFEFTGVTTMRRDDIDIRTETEEGKQ